MWTRFSAVATFAVLALVPSSSGALAAPVGAVDTEVFLRDLTLPAGGPAVGDFLSFVLTSDRAGWANEVTLTVDTAAAGDVADVVVKEAHPGVTCSTAGTVTRCTVPGPHRVMVVPDGGDFTFLTFADVLISLAAKPGATPGDAGVLTLTARADAGPITSKTSRLRVGEGVNLTAIDTPSRSVPPGGSATVRPQVRNSGPREVQGLTLAINGERTLAGTDFGNCTYEDVKFVACTFDTTLTAGATYEVSSPFTVRIPPGTVAGSETGVNAQWLTRAEWQDLGEGFSDGRQGSGPDLELDEVASAAADPVPQADIDGDDNGTSSMVTVSGSRRADIVAVGAAITGSRGERHTIEVGLVNRGPGTLRYPPFYNNLPGIYVTLPSGLSVLRADERCSLLFEDDPADRLPSTPADPYFEPRPPEYVCRPESVQARPGQRLTFAFTVRAVQSGEGSVDVLINDGETTVDRNAGNNSAPITVTIAGEEGGLPVTGATAATVAGLGLLLLLVGAVVMMTPRRSTERSGAPRQPGRRT